MTPGPADAGRILVVEDEPRLAGVLRDYLHAAGFATEWVADGDAVLGQVKAWKPDLLLLDLMLPGRDGVDICRELRTRSDMPVIMITARVEELDRLLGLEVGADDYVCKPFSPREVIARVQAVLRRYRREPGAAAAPGLQLDEAGWRASWQGQDLNLTQVEFRLLHALAATPGRVYSRDQLMDRLYSDHRIVTDRTVDSHVRNLRRKLADAGAADLIGSIYGLGYRFDG